MYRKDEKVRWFSNEGEWVEAVYVQPEVRGWHLIITGQGNGFQSVHETRIQPLPTWDDENSDDESWEELMGRLDTTVRAIERQQVSLDARASLKVLSEGIQTALDAIADKVEKMFFTLQKQILELEKRTYD